MWTRISNGIHSSLSKCGGSVDQFVQEILMYVHADPSFLTRDVLLLEAVRSMVEIGDPGRDLEAEVLACFRNRNMLLIPLAKEKWGQEKKRRASK